MFVLRAVLYFCFGVVVGGVALPWRFWRIHDSLRYETEMSVYFAGSDVWYAVHMHNLWTSEYFLGRSRYKGPDAKTPPKEYRVREWPPQPPWWAPEFGVPKYETGMLCKGFGWPLRAWGWRDTYEIDANGRPQVAESGMVILPLGVILNALVFGGVLCVTAESFLVAHRTSPAVRSREGERRTNNESN